MGARLQTTPQALWLFQPTPAQVVQDAAPRFKDGLVVGQDPAGSQMQCEINNSGAVVATEFSLRIPGNGCPGGDFVIIDRWDIDPCEPQVTSHYRAFDTSPGIDSVVTVLTALPNTFSTLTFKDGLLVSVV